MHTLTFLIACACHFQAHLHSLHPYSKDPSSEPEKEGQCFVRGVDEDEGFSRIRNHLQNPTSVKGIFVMMNALSFFDGMTQGRTQPQDTKPDEPKLILSLLSLSEDILSENTINALNRFLLCTGFNVKSGKETKLLPLLLTEPVMSPLILVI